MLDRFSKRILKYINKNPGVELLTLNDKFKQDCSDWLNFLKDSEYIIFSAADVHIDNSGKEPCAILNYEYYATPMGMAYLQNLTSERVKYWVPIVIADLLSIAALIVSISK